MMNIQKLQDYVIDKFELKGFERANKGTRSESNYTDPNYGRLYLPGDCELEVNTDIHGGKYICDMWGIHISVQPVYRSNGTSENTSVRIIIIKHTHDNPNFGRYLYQDKIYNGLSDRSIDNKINKAIQMYQQVVKG